MSLDKKMKEIWAREKVRFNQPAIKEPEIVPSIEGQDSAAFDWLTRTIQISKGFVKDLSKYMTEEDILKGCLRHETGHWVYFPRELSDQLYLSSQAHQIFKGKGLPIYQFYADLSNEGHILKNHQTVGKEILQMREVFSKMALGKGDKVSSMLNNFLRAMYANSMKDLPPVPLNTEEQKVFEKLKDIPFLDLSLDDHVASLYRFGKAIENLLPEHCTNSTRCKHGKIDGIPVKEIDRALSDILDKKGVRGYRMVKKMLKDLRPDFQDPYGDNSDKAAAIGAGHQNFARHDEQIPLYRRWAANYGVYIVKRPIESDETALFRQGKKDFEVGDSVQKLDIFGSRGQIAMPGVSKVHMEEEGTLPSVAWSVPHLNLGIDSSGSMPSPDDTRGSPAVLAAFVLGKNYHANGSMVGGWNFSEDIAFVAPSREIEPFYSLMCGRWGGGTVLNTEKLKKLLEEARFGDSRVIYSDEKDLQRIYERLSDEDKKKVTDKSLILDMKKVQAKYEKLDNVIITDGFIGNIEDVVSYLNGLGKITRNFVFITDKRGYADWNKHKLPNTWVYLAEKPEDLKDLALARTKALNTEANTNYRGVR